MKKIIHQYGKAGWGIILFCFFMFYTYIALINDGTNVLAPRAAENIGVSLGSILQANGYAGIFAVIGYIISGQINNRLGERYTCAILLSVSGIAYIFCGKTHSLGIYTAAMAICSAGLLSAGYVAGGTLIAKWFPKKKGLVMGYVTMGNNTASATFVALLTWLVKALGNIQRAVIPVGIAAMALGLIGLIFIRNDPAQRHQNPDNVSDEVYQKTYCVEQSDGGWTIKKLLKTKEVWQCAIYTGLLQVCSIGVMQQLIQRNVSTFHMKENDAILLMTVLALVALVCSWIIGFIDDKIGTKRTMQLFGIWYAIAFVINVLAAGKTNFLFYLSIFMIAMGIGGSGNFTISLPASVFGRHGFEKVNSVLFPIQGFVTAWCFVIDGVIMNKFGNLNFAYILFAGSSLLVSLLVSFIDEHKFNKDYQAAVAGKTDIPTVAGASSGGTDETI